MLTAGTVNAPRVMYNIATDGGLGLNRTIEDNAYHGLPKDTEALLDKKGEGDIIEGENKDVEKHQNGQKEVYEGTIKSHKVAPDTLTSVQWKTHDYILNKEHSTGKSKALWFERALGISRKNAEILNGQLIFDANKAVKTAETEYGIKYNQITTILGAHGRKIDVVVVWIKNNDGVVRLVTIIPTKK